MPDTQTPLERAARALAEAEVSGMRALGIQVELPHWPHYIVPARAVLMALREPSNAMLNAGNDGVYDQSGDTNPFVIWQDMIDAAMTEGEGA